MKKLLICCGLTCLAIAANADNLPAGNYSGNLSEGTSSWSWDTALNGTVDNNGNINVAIPANPHLANLKGSLNATVAINGGSCDSSNAQVKVGVLSSNVTFSNCAWDGNTLNADYATQSIMGFVISGHVTLAKSQ